MALRRLDDDRTALLARRPRLRAARGPSVGWDLAGGYQREPDGSIPKVLETLNNPKRPRAARYLGPAR